ncbi:MAG: hypothetical protein CMI27_05545, partial [Opitutae bacterium]|nr:hypothetical protein [Opitutae bacterium]
MPSGYSIYKILRPPYDSTTGNVVGTFLNATTNGQTTSSSATFFFNPSSPDYFGTFYVEWNGTNASTGVVTEHTKDNSSNNYLSIPITSTNDVPVLSITAVELNSNGNFKVNEGNTLVANVSVSDADGGTPDINVTGGLDAALFTHSNGKINFNSSSGFDYEFPQDNGVDNIYNIVISATDSNNTSSSQAIVIEVANVNDPPEIVQGDSDLIVTIDEDANLTAWAEATGGSFALTVSDSDIGSSNFTWSVSSAARNGTATITDNNNNCTIVYTPTADIWGQDTASSPTTGQT